MPHHACQGAAVHVLGWRPGRVLSFGNGVRCSVAVAVAIVVSTGPKPCSVDVFSVVCLCCCAGAAVLGGKHLAEHIHERMVAYL